MTTTAELISTAMPHCPQCSQDVPIDTIHRFSCPSQHFWCEPCNSSYRRRCPESALYPCPECLYAEHLSELAAQQQSAVEQPSPVTDKQSTNSSTNSSTTQSLPDPTIRLTNERSAKFPSADDLVERPMDLIDKRRLPKHLQECLQRTLPNDVVRVLRENCLMLPRVPEALANKTLLERIFGQYGALESIYFVMRAPNSTIVFVKYASWTSAIDAYIVLKRRSLGELDESLRDETLVLLFAFCMICRSYRDYRRQCLDAGCNHWHGPIPSNTLCFTEKEVHQANYWAYIDLLVEKRVRDRGMASPKAFRDSVVNPFGLSDGDVLSDVGDH